LQGASICARLLKKGCDDLESTINAVFFSSEKAREIISKQKPIEKKIVDRVKAALVKKGTILEQSPEWDEHLIRNYAEAVTYSDGTIIMHTKVSASGFFEELIHYGQVKSGRAIFGDHQNNLEMEIEAKEKLLRNQRAYGVTDFEVELLTNTLQKYRIELETLKKGGE